MDNMFKSAGIRGQAPRLAPTQATPLMEPKELLEHANLAKSTMQMGRSNNRRGKAYSSRGPAADHNRVDSSANENHPRPSSNNPFRKDFRSQTHPKDHHPQRASK